jgi:hypothetical protein
LPLYSTFVQFRSATVLAHFFFVYRCNIRSITALNLSHVLLNSLGLAVFAVLSPLTLPLPLPAPCLPACLPALPIRSLSIFAPP